MGPVCAGSREHGVKMLWFRHLHHHHHQHHSCSDLAAWANSLELSNWEATVTRRLGLGLVQSVVLFLFLFFLDPRLQHMEVPRLRVESEQQLPAYATAKATQDPRPV